MRAIYRAADEEQATQALGALSTKWSERYPQPVKSWQQNWVRLSSHYKYTEPLRRLINTTNPIEGFHARLRKVTKTKRLFDGDTALLKLIYLAQKRIVTKFADKQVFSWKAISAELHLVFGDRFIHQ